MLNSCHVTDPIYFISLPISIRKVHVKFHLDLISSFSEKVATLGCNTVEKTLSIMHNFANLCKIMNANDPILISSLCLNITMAYLNFHLDQISSF